MAPKETDVKSQREILVEMNNNLNKVLNALHGDEHAGIDGYFKRVQKLEKAEDKRGKIYVFISTVSAGISLGIYKIAEFLHK